MEINGFKIDKFNQYNLKENTKYSICPLCSHDRTKSKEKCAMLDWDTGLGTCSHCGEVFQLHTFKRKEQKKIYKKPEWKNNTELPDKIVKHYEENRKISQNTLKKAKITFGRSWMPQFKKEMPTIQYNYFRFGELINIKYRAKDKNFKLFKDAELILYNLDSIQDEKECYIVEGECFTPESELLTRFGWVKFSDYNGQEVMQFENGKGEFIKPIAFFKKKYNDDLIEFKNNQRFYSLTTKNHNILLKNNNGKLLKKTANNLYDIKSGYSIPRTISGIKNNKGLDISDELLMFYVAVSADKLFPHEWIGMLSNRQIHLILDEILHWDGNSVPNRNQIEYSSKSYENALFIQTLSHLAGYTSTIIRRSNKFGKWFKVSILFNKQTSSTQSLQKTKIPYNDYVYCVQVPSSNILVRQNECISISGNCDVLSLIEVGKNNVVSVPNGANIKKNNLEYLDNCIDWFVNKEKIYLCVDNDEAGKVLESELKRRLGIERCYFIDLEDQKDANDYLVKYGRDKLRMQLNNPIPYPLDDIVTFEEDGDLFDEFWIKGMPEGKRINLNSFDEVFRVDDEGRFVVVTGIPSHGKSEFVDHYVTSLCILHGWKVGFCSPENTPVRLHKAKIFKKIIGFTPDQNSINNNDYLHSKEFLNDNFFFTDFKDGNYDLIRILEKAKELIFRKGIKIFVIDPYNKCRLKKSLNKNITDYTNDYLSLIDEFSKKYKCLIVLVAHPIKMQKDLTGKREMPDFYSIKGGGEWYDMSPFGLSVHRDFEKNITLVKILKIKFQHLGTNQAEVELKYNVNNGRFTEINNDVPLWDNSNWLKKGISKANMITEQIECPDFNTIVSNFENEVETPF